MTPLIQAVSDYAGPGDHVADLFSGSLSVSMGLKEAGYKVTANDVNLFSAVLADAYLVHNEPPPVELRRLLPVDRIAGHLLVARAQASTLAGSSGFAFLSNDEWRQRYEEFLAVLDWLAKVQQTDLPTEFRRTDFFDAYCEEGAFSAFVSQRGSVGNRRFFSPANASRIDLILNQVRVWKRADALSPHAYALILATLLRGVEKVSNTQGTYHDFPRTTWDSRALAALTLIPPALDAVVAGVGGHRAGREADSLDFVGSVAPHSVLYLDPPYNFRQYSAYYFMPNVICRYSEIEDLDAYFGNLSFVRGQNPEDDFTSTFCKPAHFIEDMTKLISRANCETVMISYFTGKNHWSQFDSESSDTGRQMLEQMLTSDAYVRGSLDVREIPRKNYASYGGFKARDIDELIMIARVRQDETHGTPSSTQLRLQPVA